MISSLSYDLKTFNYKIENNRLVVFERDLDPYEILHGFVEWQSSSRQIDIFNDLMSAAHKCVAQKKYSKETFEAVIPPMSTMISPVSVGNA